MVNLLEWPRALFYQTRTFDESTEDGLQLLLTNIFEKAKSQGGVEIATPSQALNAAYAMAVALQNTHVKYFFDYDNLKENIERAMKGYMGYENLVVAPLADYLMCGWMAYAILYLQSTKSLVISNFLEHFKKMLMDRGILPDYQKDQQHKLEFAESMPCDIERITERYSPDLTSNPPSPKDILARHWKFVISDFTQDEFRYLLMLYDNKEHQHELLSLAWEKLSVLGRSAQGKHKLILTETVYQGYCQFIDEGEYLSSPQHSDSEAITRDDWYNWQDKTIMVQKAQIDALQKQLDFERKRNANLEGLSSTNASLNEALAMMQEQYNAVASLKAELEEQVADNVLELEKMQDLSDKVVQENEKLKADYVKLGEDFEKVKILYNELVKEAYGDVAFCTDGKGLADMVRKQYECRRDFQEWVDDSISKGIKEVVKFCTQYACDIKKVYDGELDHFKQLIQDLLNSSLSTRLQSSDMLELYQSISKVNGQRQEQREAIEREKIQRKSEEDNRALFEHLHVNGEQVIVGGNGEYKNEAIDYDTTRNIGSAKHDEG